MKDTLFADTLFVAYHPDAPREGRIPYTAGAALTAEVLGRLERQLLAGQVRSIQMNDATGGSALEADFREGWATVYIVREEEHYYELVNREAPDDETPLSITGDGPTPTRHATRDIPLMAAIVGEFARTGSPLADCLWEESIH